MTIHMFGQKYYWEEYLKLHKNGHLPYTTVLALIQAVEEGRKVKVGYYLKKHKAAWDGAPDYKLRFIRAVLKPKEK